MPQDGPKLGQRLVEVTLADIVRGFKDVCDLCAPKDRGQRRQISLDHRHKLVAGLSLGQRGLDQVVNLADGRRGRVRFQQVFAPDHIALRFYHQDVAAIRIPYHRPINNKAFTGFKVQLQRHGSNTLNCSDG